MSPRPLAAFVLLALAALAPTAIAGPGDAYVTSDASNLARQYAGGTGAYQSVFTSSVAASGQLGIHFGNANNRVLIGHWGGGVEEFDATTGAYIKTYNAGGGTQWAGLYAPTGGVYIGSWTTGDVREYDATTGALIRVVAGVSTPADMRFGPGNRLFIESYNGGYVMAVHAVSGAFMGLWPMPYPSKPNDIAFLPSGDILVTCMSTDSVYHFSPAFTPLGAFASPGWVNPHGIEIGPTDGRIYVVEGGAGQVHVFDPATFAELNTAWLTPAPGDKVVDLAFRPGGGPTPATPSSWGSIKRRYR
ncbi:MAG TPA: hypothetical protein VGK89_12560 [Candidatus Eisenbacteria bacterium]|jgi:DNA-binding beta-propeller fold protein YncE